LHAFLRYCDFRVAVSFLSHPVHTTTTAAAATTTANLHEIEILQAEATFVCIVHVEFCRNPQFTRFQCVTHNCHQLQFPTKINCISYSLTSCTTPLNVIKTRPSFGWKSQEFTKFTKAVSDTTLTA